MLLQIFKIKEIGMNNKVYFCRQDNVTNFLTEGFTHGSKGFMFDYRNYSKLEVTESIRNKYMVCDEKILLGLNAHKPFDVSAYFIDENGEGYYVFFKITEKGCVEAVW